MGDNLNTQSEESCTQCKRARNSFDSIDCVDFERTQSESRVFLDNVLKVARHLYQWSANASLFDFYERAILNGILGNQNRLDPAVTSFIYMLPMGSGVKKP